MNHNNYDSFLFRKILDDGWSNTHCYYSHYRPHNYRTYASFHPTYNFEVNFHNLVNDDTYRSYFHNLDQHSVRKKKYLQMYSVVRPKHQLYLCHLYLSTLWQRKRKNHHNRSNHFRQNLSPLKSRFHLLNKFQSVHYFAFPL